MKEKVLIIKLGYSETLAPGVEYTTSLGDVLRTTVILHNYKNSHVTWLTSREAFDLLEGNPYIHRLLTFDEFVPFQLMRERFDTVINFERIPGICALSDSIDAWRRYGFRFDPETGTVKAYEGSQHALHLALSNDAKKKNRKTWEELLFEMVGAKWKGEKPILGYKPRTSEIYDVGFNYAVGKKWPNKAWPLEHWKDLEKLLKMANLKIDWQKGMNNIKEYIDWINSCRLIVTNDSLGLHIAHALGKRIVALFGPTSEAEIYLEKDRSIKLTPDVDYDCIPCHQRSCSMEKKCMWFIEPEKVYRAIKHLLG